jgi:translation elongation factor EF-Tu-like GTPase
MSSSRIDQRGAVMTLEDLIEIGRVTGYFARIGVAGIDLSKPLRVGDSIRIRGHTTDLEQVVDSIEIEHEPVQEAKAGDKIGIKTADRCRDGDHVYKVVD